MHGHVNHNAQAAAFLAAYVSNTVPDGGLAFATALQQAKLDYSPASLERLDQLLRQICEKLKPQKEAFWGDLPRRNFCLMVAYYVGIYIDKHKTSTASLVWHDRESALATMPKDARIPDVFATRLLAQFDLGENSMLCTPLAVLDAGLFCATPSLTAQELVTHMLMQLKVEEPINENQRCQQYLDDFFEGAPLPGGLMAEADLRALRLDYSLDSIKRLDTFLFSIGEHLRTRLGKTNFLGVPQGRNLMILLGYYLGSTIARNAQCMCLWLNREQLRERVPNLMPNFEHSNACEIGNFIVCPMSVLGMILFEPEAGKSCVEFVGKTLAEKLPRMTSIRRSASSEHKPELKGLLGRLGLRQDNGSSPHWLKAMREAGFLAALAMSNAADGRPVSPMRLAAKTGQKGLLFDDMFLGSSQNALEMNMRAMTDNPDDFAYQAFVFDAFANLPTGRTDALRLDIRSYAEPELHVFLSLPYRNARHRKGFAIFSPKLMECSAGLAEREALFTAFFVGVDSFESPMLSHRETVENADFASAVANNELPFSWLRYADESI